MNVPLPRVTYANVRADFSGVHELLDRVIPDVRQGLLGLERPHLVNGTVLAGLARSQERQLVELAQLEFDGLTAALAPLVPRDDVWEMFDLLDRLTRRDSGLRPVAATLVDPMGRVVVSSHPEAWPLGAPAQALVGAAVPVEAFRYDAPAREVTVRAVLTHQGRPLGQMVIAFDASALLAERARATRAMPLRPYPCSTPSR